MHRAVVALRQSLPMVMSPEAMQTHMLALNGLAEVLETMAHPVATIEHNVLHFNHLAPQAFKDLFKQGKHVLYAAAPCRERPSTAGALEILQRWQTAIQQLAQEFEPVLTAFGQVVEGPVPDALTGMECALTDATADLLGCTREELQWHWLENQFGAKRLVCVRNGQERAIATLEDFAWSLGFSTDEEAGGVAA
jgi:hypothetical protein